MDKPNRLFELLIERHKAMVYSVCFMYATSREEADDIFQEVLVNIWKGLSSLRTREGLSLHTPEDSQASDMVRGGKSAGGIGNEDLEGNVPESDADRVTKSWIYRISLNTCISYKRKKRIKTEPLELAPQLFQVDNAIGRQTEALHNRITRLEPIDRAIVLLWLENMSYEEIGAIIGIEPKNVGVRLIRIKEKLKRMNENG